MTIEHRKRYLVGPRLAKELTGVAKVAIRTRTTLDPQWLSHPRGTYQLLEFLEDFLAKPTLVESSRHIMKFFYNLRRQRGETMTEWIARHAEALWEASQAMRKVQKEFGATTSTRTSSTATTTRSSAASTASPSEARALREQWSDEDLARRDKAKMGTAYVVDGMEEEDEALLAEDPSFETQALEYGEQEAYHAEQEKIDDALAAIQTHKATLREARWKQKQIKLGRNFYPPKPFPRSSPSAGNNGPASGRGPLQCFRCGGPHKIADCPRRPSSPKWPRKRLPRLPFMPSKSATRTTTP